jgi:hypothetical protein
MNAENAPNQEHSSKEQRFKWMFGLLLLVVSGLVFLFNIYIVTSMFGRFQEGGNHQGITLWGTAFWALYKIVPNLIILGLGWTLYTQGHWAPTFLRGKVLRLAYLLVIVVAAFLLLPSFFMMCFSALWFVG